MMTMRDILTGILLPLAASALLMLLGIWSRLRWMGAIAVAAGFLAAYAATGRPEFPPHDGVDWLFWLAGPMAVVGAAAGLLWKGAGRNSVTTPRGPSVVASGIVGAALGGLLAAVAAYVVARPLILVGSVPAAEGYELAAGAMVVGAVAVWLSQWAAGRMGGGWVILAWSIALGGTGVVLMSTALRAVGIHGLSASAGTFAAGMVALAMRGKTRRIGGGASGGVAVLAAGLMGGLLSAGKFYPPGDGVAWWAAGLLMVSAGLVICGAAIPGKARWLKAVVGLLAVAIAVGALAAPAALKAMKAAEAMADDLYGP